MKPCDQWRRELADHVLDTPASPALTAHLEKCAACSAARAEWQQRMEQIDAGIRKLAASEPSADSATRVMAEVRSRRQRPLWLLERNTAAAVLAGLIIVAASGTYIWKAHEQHRETQRLLSASAAIASWESPTQGLLRSPTNSWLKSVPRLGGFFYELKASELKKEKDNP